MAYRDNGNYHAGTNGNSARYEQLSTIDRNTVVNQRTLDRLNRDFPGHGVQLGDTLSAKLVSFYNPGLSQYRPGEEVFNTSRRSVSGLAKGKVQLTDESTLELGYMKTKSEFGFIWPSAYKFLDRPEQGVPSEAEVDSYTARYVYDPDGNDLVNLSVNAWLTRQQIYENQGYSFASYDNVFDVDSKTAGMDISNTSEFSTGAGDLAVNYGAAYLDQNLVNDGLTLWDDPISNSRTLSQFQRRQWDLFASAEWKPTDWLTLEAGGRQIHSTNDQEIGTQFPSYPQFDNTLSKTTSHSGFAPNLTATVEPFAGFQVFGSYKEGIRTPSFIEGRDIPANVEFADLLPERAQTYEAGVNILREGVFAPGDELGVKASYFRNDIDDYITFTYDYVDNILGALNYDSALYSGFELSGFYDTGRIFGRASATIYDRVRLCPTSDECFDSRSDEGIPLNDWRNQVPPEAALTLTLGARFFEERLTVAGRVSHVAERAGMPDIYPGWRVPRWEPYTTVDLFGSYKFENDFKLDMSVENVFDEYYVDALAMAQQPGPGRTFKLNFSKSF